MSFSNLRFLGGEGGGEGGDEKVLKKVLFREAPLQGLTLYPFIYDFLTEKVPLLYTFYRQMVPLSHT